MKITPKIIPIKNIDLSTIDENELRVYNKRGWANELFTKEDRVLLNEKINELNPKVRQKNRQCFR